MQQTALIKELLPVLKKSLRKGDCGKIGVIGGSAEYTGAPYFSAITPMKIGADLTFVYTHPAAAPVIKGYSPELIVYPNQDFEANRQSIEKLDALVFGPGLGREEHTVELLHKVIEFAKKTPTICVVIDADGLFYIKDCYKQLAECDNNLVITPNHREFARLFEHVFPGEKVDEKHLGDQTKQLAAKLGVVVVRKGETDLISDGDNLEVCGIGTSLRRCGGQGDILSGAIALFAYWAKRMGSIGEEKIGKKPQEEEQQPPASSQPYSSMHLVYGALAATQLIRRTSLETYRQIGRSMTAADIVASIPAVIQEIDFTRPGTSMFIV